MRLDMNEEAGAFRRSLRARGLSPKTAETYLKAVTTFGAWLAEHGESLQDVTVTTRMVEDFLASELDRGLSHQTVHQHHASLSQFFKYCARVLEVPSPMVGTSPPKVTFRPPPVLATDDLKALLKACAGRGFDERRDMALLSLFMDTGIRRSEMEGIKVEDLDRDQQIVLVTGKTGTRGVPYGDKTAERLDGYLRLRRLRPDAKLPWLWLGKKGRLSAYGIEDMVARRGKQAGVKVHPHLFRHTFAHRWLDGGGNEGDLLKLAGWKSPVMAYRYGASAATARAHRAYKGGRSPVDLMD